MSAPPLSPVSPLPSISAGIALVELVPAEFPGLFANTVEVQLFNPNAAGGADVWVAFANVMSTPAFATLTFAELTPPLVGDTLTFNAVVLTAAGGPYAPGTATFSVDIRATATITVASAPVPVGATLSLVTAFGPPATLVTLTAVAGARVPGSLTFQSLVGANAQAAEIAAAINDCAWTTGNQLIQGAVDVANVVTVTAGSAPDKRGADGNTTALTRQKTTGLGLTTSTSALTVSTFTGGVNADGGTTTSSGTRYNQARDYAQNVARALIDGSNAALTAQFNGATTLPVTGGEDVLRVFATALGVLGNGLVVASSNAPAIAVTGSPTAGGVTRPVALTATTAMVIPPQGRVVLPVGREGQRNPVRPSSYWTTLPGANIGLLGQVATGGAATTLNVTYINAV